MRFELIGASIMHYASKWLPNLGKEGATAVAAEEDNRDSPWKGGPLHMIVAGSTEDGMTVQAREQRMIVESLISIFPQQDSVPCSFLLRLLRMANLLKVAPALVTELEKRVGMQFEQASLSDLLIPCYNKGETVYDVDLVQRLLEHFLIQEHTEPSSPNSQSFSEKHVGYEGALMAHPAGSSAKMRVARLVDSYLTEVSRDKNLSLTKFQVLAEALPESARSCDDGLYRAIDSYIKVLFSEQIKISNALAANSMKEGPEPQYTPMVPTRKTLLEGTPQSFQEGWATAKKDINTLKFELQTMKAKYMELQTDMENLQRQFEKMAKPKQSGSSSSAWTSGWKKLSKLAKSSAADGPDNPSQAPAQVDQTQKPRRWRNSIS